MVLFYFKDFDDWSDVGLNIAKPPGLLQLFRNYCKITIDNKEYIEQLQRKVNTQGSQILALQRENEVYSNKIRNLEKYAIINYSILSFMSVSCTRLG